MKNVFIDNIFEFNQYDMSLDEDIFESILKIRKNGFDTERFFLKYIPISELDKYDFDNKDSIKEFRDVRLSNFSPIKGMGGCNLRKDLLEKDIRGTGIKLSDPDGKILGQFDIRNHIMTYSPIFPLFYEERDLIKFANDTYFTSIPFETILLNQINHATEYYIHTGYYHKAYEVVKYGMYTFEKISKEQMIEYATKPELGMKIMKKNYNFYK